MVRHLGNYQRQESRVRLPASTSIAPVNAQEIKQVVLNLITNALDSLDAGGTVWIELAKQRPLGRADRSRQRLRHDRRSAASTCSSRSSPAAATGRGRAGPFDHLSHRGRSRRARSTSTATGRAGARTIPRHACRLAETQHERRSRTIATKPHNRLKLCSPTTSVAAGADEPRAAAHGARGDRLPRRPHRRRRARNATPTTASSSISTCRA